MFGLLFLSAVLTAAPVAACPVSPPVYVAVLLDDAAVQTRTDFSLAQIEAMRTQTGGIDRHPTLGFYGHRFGYTVKVELDRNPDSPCVKSVQIGVRMMLSERIIEIGQELTRNPCLYSIAEAHYRRHAAADDLVFGEYAKLVAPALRAAQLLPRQDDYAAAKLDTGQIEKLVDASIDASLVPYDNARGAAQQAVDSRTEALKMTSGCTAPVPRNGHA